jgi:hypothetical protein
MKAIASSITLLLLFALAACAQDAPSGTASAPAKKEAAQANGTKKDAQKKKQPEKEEEPDQPPKPKTPPPANRIIVTPGWANDDLRGNGHKFLQYATPPQGLFLHDLRAAIPIGHTGGGAALAVKAPGQEDYRYDGSLSLFHGWTRAEGWINRNQFFDPTPVVLDPSERKIQEISVEQLITRSFGLGLRYRMDEQNQAFEAPRLPLHQRTRYSDLVGEGRVGNGFLSVGVSDWRFFDRTQTLPDTSVLRWNASYLWQPIRTVGLEGSYAHHDIKQSGGNPISHIETVAFRGDAAVGRNTDLGLLVKREKRDMAITQNAFERERRIGGLSLMHRFNRWNLQLGLRQQEAERLRATQNFVDVPRWTTFDGRLSGRITKDIRLNLRGTTQDLSNLPAVTTSDSRSLVYDRRSSGGFNVSAAFPAINGYLMSNWNRQENRARDVTVESIITTAGANWEVDKKLSVFAEQTWENWRGFGGITEIPSVDNFAPDVRTSVMGLNWNIDQQTFFWATMTYFITANDNPLLLPNGNTNGTFLSFSLRHQFSRGNEVGLVLAPWKYNDSVRAGVGYNSTVIMLTGSAKY